MNLLTSEPINDFPGMTNVKRKFHICLHTYCVLVLLTGEDDSESIVRIFCISKCD